MLNWAILCSSAKLQKKLLSMWCLVALFNFCYIRVLKNLFKKFHTTEQFINISLNVKHLCDMQMNLFS